MKYFVVVLHFYQPPTQNLAITQKILNSCYLPLLRMLDQQKEVGITINLSGSLVQQLVTLQADEFFQLIKKLVLAGKVELLNSLMYHPLLPLLPEQMLSRSIEQNRTTVEAATGCQVGQGFFPPELAVNTHSLQTLSRTKKFTYAIVSEPAVSEARQTSLEPLVQFEQLQLLVGNQELIQFFRAYPGQLTADKVLAVLAKSPLSQELVILPSDAELFGHHYPDRWQVLQDLMANPDLKFVTASQAVAQLAMHPTEKVSAPATKINTSSWQDSGDLALWTTTPLQAEFLKLARMAAELTALSTDPHVWELLDQGWSSCYLYWLSNWPWWHPDLVESGATSLIKSIRSVPAIPHLRKKHAEQLYFSLLRQIWEYHWSEQVARQYQKFDIERGKMVGKLLAQ